MVIVNRRYICLLVGFVALAIAARAYAATISEVKVSDISNQSATVTWSTDASTDATINYGVDAAFGTVRYPYFDKKDHSLTIENLDPGTNYYFRVVSADDKGNTSATAGFAFKTKGNPVDKIVKEIKKITDPKELEK